MEDYSAPIAQGCRRAELLPSFFVVGPPRTGTSWIHKVLRTHAGLPEDVKETRFFDERFEHGFDWYLRHFASQHPRLPRGEIAPTYFASAEARSRISGTIPCAKIVCIFRNPVERLLSLYRVKRAHGLIRWSFEEALLHDEEMMESAKYATHLKAWRLALGEKQVLPTLYDELKCDPQSYFERVADFLGIPRFCLGQEDVHRVHSSELLTQPRVHRLSSLGTDIAEWLKGHGYGRIASKVKSSVVGHLLLQAGLPFEGLSGEAWRAAYELLRHEIEELEGLMNCDLSDWIPATCDRLPSPAVA